MNQEAGRWLIVLGVVAIGLGLWLRLGLPMPPVGHLPGDIVIHRGSTIILIPITSMVLLSVLLTLVLRWLSR